MKAMTTPTNENNDTADDTDELGDYEHITKMLITTMTAITVRK